MGDSNENIRNVVILGSGPGGMTAAIYAARANLKPLVLEGDQPGGQLTLTSEIENFPGFPEGIMGSDLVDNMRKQAERFGAEVQWGAVRKVDFTSRPLKLHMDDGSTILSKSVIISTGAKSRMLGLESEKKYFAKGVSTCATCDGAFFKNKVVAVIGGGDTACEESNQLTAYASKVYLLVRKTSMRASPIMVHRAESNPKVEIIYGASPKEFLGDDKRLTGILLSMIDGTERTLPVDGAFLAIGHIPATAEFRDSIEVDEEGFVVRKDGWSAATNVPGVFACGDVADRRYRQAITAAGSGAMAALEAQRYLESLE